MFGCGCRRSGRLSLLPTTSLIARSSPPLNREGGVWAVLASRAIEVENFLSYNIRQVELNL